MFADEKFRITVANRRVVDCRSYMNGQTREQFLSCIERSEVVEKNRLAQAVAEIDAADPHAATDCDGLADGLIERKLITRWQADMFRLGKSSGFILGQYKLLGLLGAGHSWSIFLGEHRLFHVLRAIKVLPVRRINNAAWIARFVNGASAASLVNHRNVLGAFDVGVHGKHHFIVMEYVDGCDLQTVVANQGPLEWRVAVDYIHQAAEAVAHLHQIGFVHRDVKPSHLMVDKQGVVRLLDLSMARRLGQQNVPTLAADDEPEWETLDFLAPEQARDPNLVDQRTDIYSLGCTLFYLLAGHPPFAPGRNTVQRILMNQTAEPPDLGDFRCDVPPKLADLCSRMMARSPDDRPQAAAEVVAELTAIT
jgi:eukaryotic-like serine/threonine-protein kinase